MKLIDRQTYLSSLIIGIVYDFSGIEEMKEKIDKHRPFTKRLADSLHDKLIIEWTYNSKAIEGNTLTLAETKVVLEGITIGGVIHIPPKHYEISALMQNLIMEYKEEWQSYHPIVRATLLHGEFVKIHPFIDGNGRTSRLLLNFELMKNGYPPIIIKKESRAQYYNVLDRAHTTMDYQPFLEFVAKLVIESEQLWLSLIE